MARTQPAAVDVARLLTGRLVLSNGGPSALVTSHGFCALTSTVPVRQFDIVVPLAPTDVVCGAAADRTRLASPENDVESTFWVLSLANHLLRYTQHITPTAPYVPDRARALDRAAGSNTDDNGPSNAADDGGLGSHGRHSAQPTATSAQNKVRARLVRPHALRRLWPN